MKDGNIKIIIFQKDSLLSKNITLACTYLILCLYEIICFKRTVTNNWTLLFPGHGFNSNNAVLHYTDSMSATKNWIVCRFFPYRTPAKRTEFRPDWSRSPSISNPAWRSQRHSPFSNVARGPVKEGESRITHECNTFRNGRGSFWNT